MLTRWLAAGCAVAGVTVLAGLGWGLLAAALVLAVLPEPSAMTSWVSGKAGRIRGAAVDARKKTRQLVTARGGGRRVVAQGQMGAALVLGPIGTMMWVGIGAGLIVAAAGLAAVSLLVGWNA